MSIPLFPLRALDGSTLTVPIGFPTDNQLLSLDTNHWPSFSAQYQTSPASGRVSVLAPLDGRIRFVERTILGTPVYLLEFRPDIPLDFQAMPGWASPIPRSIVISVSALDDESSRLVVFSDAIRVFRRRGGHRKRARFEGGRLRQVDPIDLSSGDITTLAQNALDGNYDISVEKGQEILNTTASINLGMIHYSGENLDATDASIYWMDVHEYFIRLKRAFPDDSSIGFSFRHNPSDMPFRMRHEKKTSTAMSGDNHINTLIGGMQEVAIYHPPTQNLTADHTRYTDRSLAIPDELFLLSPGADASLTFSRSTVDHRLYLFRNQENESRVWRSDPRSGREISLRFSAVTYSWPATRFEPYNLALIANNNVGISFNIMKDLLDTVRRLTRTVFEQKERFANYIRQGDNAIKIKMLENINRIINGAPSSFRDDLRGALDNSVFTGFSVSYMGIKNDKDRAVILLKNSMNDQFFAQFKADPTDANIEIFNNALDALENEHEGDIFIRSITNGFMVKDIHNSSATAPVDFDWFKSIWSTQRRFRGPAVAWCFKMVRQDMFHHARIAHQQIRLHPDQVRYLIRIRGAYRARFGELFSITTSEYTTTSSQVRNILTDEVITRTHTQRTTISFSLDTDVEIPGAGSMSGGTIVADAFGHALNAFNLLGSLWRICEDTVKVYRGDQSYQAIYDLTKDMVSLSSDIYHLMPSRHYTGISRGPGFAEFFRGFSVVFGTVSMAKMLMSTNDLHASGNYLSADLTAIAAAGSAVTISAEALVIMGLGSASSGGMAIIIVAGAVFSIAFELMANALRDPEIVVDFSHTMFGEDYANLQTNYDGLTDTVRNNFVQSFLLNNRNSWVRNLYRQVAHLNNYLWPLNATLTNREVNEPGSTRRVREISISIVRSRAKAYSRVYFELFSPGTPDFGTKGTFVIDPRSFRGVGWHPIVIGTAGTSPSLQYQATAGTGESVSLQIKTYAPLGSPLSGINKGVIAVTFDESIEYTLDPSDPNLSSLGIAPSLIRNMRSNPFDLRLHESPMENNANKSQAFISTS